MPSRALPRVGQSVTVHFLAEQVPGTIAAVDLDLRGLEVLTVENELIRFELQPTTGRFQTDGQIGARLSFDSAER
jgi:hypothetical protein